MTIKYGEYKDFLRELYDFCCPKPRTNEDDLEIIKKYLEDNVTVEVPADLYNVASEYKQAKDKFQDMLLGIINDELKKRRTTAKTKKSKGAESRW